MSLYTIDTCRNNGIDILTIPPHTSHRMQPLDVAVYGPFKRFYNTALDGWMRSNAGKTCTIYHIPGVVKTAFASAFTLTNIRAGFLSTGIFPFSRCIFKDEDFAPSALIQASDYANTTTETSPTIDISLPLRKQNEVEERIVTSVIDNPLMSAGHSTVRASQSSNQVMNSEVNSSMVSSSSIFEVEATSVNVTERPYISPKNIHQFLQVLRNRNRAIKKSRVRYTRILTDTPQRHKIFLQLENRKQNSLRKHKDSETKKSEENICLLVESDDEDDVVAQRLQLMKT